VGSGSIGFSVFGVDVGGIFFLKKKCVYRGGEFLSEAEMNLQKKKRKINVIMAGVALNIKIPNLLLNT